MRAGATAGFLPLVLVLFLLTMGCAWQESKITRDDQNFFPALTAGQGELEAVADIDVLALSDAMRTLLDRTVMIYAAPEERDW